MKWKYCYKALLGLLLTVFCNLTLVRGQSATFEVFPYFNGTTSINDGIIELGLELKRETFLLRPSLRLPLTDKKNGLVRIDRYTSEWKAILPLEWVVDRTGEDGRIKRTMFSFQGEWARNNFKYYPTGNAAEESQQQGNSFAGEVKLILFRMNPDGRRRQYSPQVRVRYSSEWKAADEIGVIRANNGQNFSTLSNLVVQGPSRSPQFSPAAALNYYPGAGNFSFTPAAYYDFNGNRNSADPFGNSERLRIEGWIFYYPLINNTPNVKIGLAPFYSLRTKGTDALNKVEVGGQITLRVGTTFLQFF